jgi:hypothetical protein
MTDVTNPGVVEAEDEVYESPDPNGGSAQAVPRQTGALVPVANYARKPAVNGVSARLFSTPAEAGADAPVYVPPVSSTPVPPAPEIVVANQCLTGVDTAEFTVVGPVESFQTNATTQDQVTLTVTGVFDADHLPSAPSASTTRYYLSVLVPPLLTSYPVSLLGRQVVFTSGVDQDAARFITGYGASFVVVDRDDPTDDSGGVPTLDAPSPGDTLTLDVARRGSEQVNTAGETVNVVVSPPPPVNVPMPSQGILGGGTTNQSTGPQPVPPPLTSGVDVPSAINVDVADQPPPTFPTNIFV